MEKDPKMQPNQEKVSEQAKNQYDEHGDLILDQEILELYDSLRDKSRMVVANMVFFLNKMDEMSPADRERVAKELDSDLDALLKKIEKK